MNNKYLLATALAAVLCTAQAQQAPAVSTPSAKQLSHLCNGCAWVKQVHTETRKGSGSGAGAVGGAVIGGLLGNQVGGGTGKKLATVGGAVAGGYAGNEVEKNMKKRTVWIVQLVHKDGSARQVELAANPNLRAGDTVREKDGQLTRS